MSQPSKRDTFPTSFTVLATIRARALAQSAVASVPCQPPSFTRTPAALAVPRMASRTMASANVTFEPSVCTSVLMSPMSDVVRAREEGLRYAHARRCKADPGETGAGKGCDEMYEGGWARLGAAEGVGFFEILLQKR